MVTPPNGRVTQLARMLMHNGGLLANITVIDCVEACRAQTGYANARQHSLWYALLRDSRDLAGMTKLAKHRQSPQSRTSRHTRHYARTHIV
jgi:hypothetical protein